MFLFFFKQKTAYEMRISDWSSDVCSSDLPKPGVVFKDITPLLADHDGFTAVVEALAAAGRDADGNVVIDKVVGMEARGFMFAARSEERRVGKECVST